jgi:YD repeat-containing protein
MTPQPFEPSKEQRSDGGGYQTEQYSVNPTNGDVSASALATNCYYDAGGNLIAEDDPGGLSTKDIYDGAGTFSERGWPKKPVAGTTQ